MTEEAIRALIREEIAAAVRPLALALKQGNNTVTKEIDRLFELGEFKRK